MRGLRGKRVAVLAAGTILLLGLAACGTSADDGKKAASAPASAASPAAASPAADAQTVNVEAADFSWTLSTTEFKAGQPIVFQLDGKEGAHGFSIVGTDVRQPIAKGETKEVTWTPAQPGEYTIKCVVMCGSGHSSMETVIKVV